MWRILPATVGVVAILLYLSRARRDPMIRAVLVVIALVLLSLMLRIVCAGR
jgi:asparagine N-glycosylation enzyme membrane subunit Stt3